MNSRSKLLDPTSTTDIISRLIHKELKGSALDAYGRLVLTVASADGELSQDEAEYLFRVSAQRGIDEEVIEGWRAFNWRQSRLLDAVLELKEQLPTTTYRLVLYDAIAVAYSDGLFPEQERDAVIQTADLLEIPTTEVGALIALVEAERAHAALREHLLSRGTGEDEVEG